jgi:hypothetical protein
MELISLNFSASESHVRPCAGTSRLKQARTMRSDAGVVQWQNGSFPSCIRGFDSLHPLHSHYWAPE